MATETKYECEDGGEVFTQNQLSSIEKASERIAPGQPMPAGQCPQCGACAMNKKQSGNRLSPTSTPSAASASTITSTPTPPPARKTSGNLPSSPAATLP